MMGLVIKEGWANSMLEGVNITMERLTKEEVNNKVE